jgi:hypothetical protein
MPEIKSHKTIKTMPMAKKLGAPIFLKKSEKYSTVSIAVILSKNRCLKKNYMPDFRQAKNLPLVGHGVPFRPWAIVRDTPGESKG